MRKLLPISLALILFSGLGWAALAPVAREPREALYVIPAGTSARRLAGESDLEVLPQTIRLSVHDTLALHNADNAPHLFGPTLVMPGQTFRLPFAQAATYSFLCTAHTEGQLNVVVEPPPAPGWERISWRWRQFWSAV